MKLDMGKLVWKQNIKNKEKCKLISA